jgi:hypothetical protein
VWNIPLEMFEIGKCAFANPHLPLELKTSHGNCCCPVSIVMNTVLSLVSISLVISRTLVEKKYCFIQVDEIEKKAHIVMSFCSQGGTVMLIL